MIIYVSDDLLTTIAKLEGMERSRLKKLDLTFCWTYDPSGLSADGLAFNSEGEPYKQFDVAIVGENQLILERPVYSDFEVQWDTHPYNKGWLE